MGALLNRAWQVTVTPPSQTTSAFDLSANGGVSNTSSQETLVINNLRVVFHVTKTLLKSPNTMKLEIFNLSDASRSKMRDKNLAVSLEAGYINANLGTNTRAVIFSGNTRVCDHKHETANWETQILCGDGEQLMRTTRVVKSYAPGSANFMQAIKFVAQQMHLNLGNLESAINSGGLPFQAFDQGLALNGSASSVFDSLMRTAGYNWSVQQGALLIVKSGEAATQEVVVLSKDTGLIGSPEHTPPHKAKRQSFLTAKSLLNPKIRPGYLVRMDALNVKGDFVVQKVIHAGDSHGQDWTTHFEALAAQTTGS